MNKFIPICALSIALTGCFDSDDKDSYDDINQAPVANDLAITTQTERPVTDMLTATDADGDGLTYALSGEPAFGSVTVTSSGEFTYTPNAEVTGTDSFSFTVSDGTAFAVTGNVTITIEALEVPVSTAVRSAFNQNADDKPLAVNGRLYIQDTTNPAEFDDLLNN